MSAPPSPATSAKDVSAQHVAVVEDQDSNAAVQQQMDRPGKCSTATQSEKPDHLADAVTHQDILFICADGNFKLNRKARGEYLDTEQLASCLNQCMLTIRFYFPHIPLRTVHRNHCPPPRYFIYDISCAYAANLERAPRASVNIQSDGGAGKADLDDDEMPELGEVADLDEDGDEMPELGEVAPSSDEEYALPTLPRHFTHSLVWVSVDCASDSRVTGDLYGIDILPVPPRRLAFDSASGTFHLTVRQISFVILDWTSDLFVTGTHRGIRIDLRANAPMAKAPLLK
ncbi:hypothetical protein FB451DRAFT_1190870 [Mycena latifolia]|nr:hypothetical protein FB451DRAFT_1190870 [Mycena latifolia]